MNKNLIEEIAMEETRRAFPELEKTYPNLFIEIVQTVVSTIVDDWASDAFNSELILRKLITLDLENIKKALG